MTKLAPEWVRTSDPVIRSPARYRWTTAPARKASGNCAGRIPESGRSDLGIPMQTGVSARKVLPARKNLPARKRLPRGRYCRRCGNSFGGD